MAETLHNIKLTMAYDGSHYHGWQRQSNQMTVQEVIEDNIQKMSGETVKLIASGRTDAGVHAINQVCNFQTRSDLDPEVIRKGLNSLLSDDILITGAEYVPIEFHARYSAKSKTYEYRVLNRKEPDIFRRNYLWHVPMPLDVEEMTRCLSVLRGRYDFSSFKSSGSGNIDPVREVLKAELYGPKNGRLRIVLEAEGFLRHMVRNIVGTVVDAGLGKLSAMRFKVIFESKDRRLAGLKAPAHGLFLINVRY